jgi:ubiquinone/menaquinone biosynthesis C-methylase UbiE
MGDLTNRILEPELMLDFDQCNQYNTANRVNLRNIFLEEINNNFIIEGTIADLGCGLADYSIELYDRFQNIDYIDAYDGSSTMLEIAKSNLDQSKKVRKIKLINKLFNDIDEKYDIIYSNNTLHHLHNPDDFWKTIRRLSKPNSSIFIMDLIRPKNTKTLDNLVYMCDEGKIGGELFLNDFRNSLLASFSIDEIKKQLSDNGFDSSLIKINERSFESIWTFAQNMSQ